jgi:prepilin-type N-terminal cleavage/methylation domain-containing protein
MHSSLERKPARFARGFTLIELLISASIIALVTALVLVKYKSFDSSVLLKDTAYEIALALREAQIKSVSVVQRDDSFDYPYGISFTDSAANSKQFTAFYDTDNDTPPQQDPTGEVLQTFTIGGSMEVDRLCVDQGAGWTCGDDNVDRLDISFKRPNFNAIFYASEGGNAPMGNISSAKIIVKSPNGTDSYAVIVSGLGQITVKKEP